MFFIYSNNRTWTGSQSRDLQVGITHHIRTERIFSSDTGSFSSCTWKWSPLAWTNFFELFTQLFYVISFVPYLFSRNIKHKNIHRLHILQTSACSSKKEIVLFIFSLFHQESFYSKNTLFLNWCSHKFWRLLALI